MDRGMPKMDGFTCPEKSWKKSEAKIIIVSGYEENGPDGIDENTKNLIRATSRSPAAWGN